MMLIAFLLSLLLLCASPDKRNVTGNNLVDNILFLCGAGDISQADSQMVEHLMDLSENPLKINCMSRSALISSGLFSSYQAESILDWRSRNGDILSGSELGIVDAFTPLTASALVPFLSFEPSGGKDAVSFSGEALSTFAAKVADGSSSFRWQDRLKGSAATSKGIFSASASVRSPWKSRPAAPDEYPWYVSFEGNKWLSRVIAGNFNARLAQGIALWSGVTISDGSTPESLMRKPSGIYPYGGFGSGTSMFGAAVRADFGHFDAIAFADHVGRQFGGAIGWNHHHGSVGINAVFPDTAVSADVQQTINGSVLFGELCLRPHRGPGTLTALVGYRFPISNADCAARISYTDDKIEACGAVQCLFNDRKHNVFCSGSYDFFVKAESSRPPRAMQTRCRATWTYTPVPAWSLCLRAGARLRNWEKNRFELRQEVEYSHSRWNFSLRGDVVRCNAHAFLLCLESSYDGVWAKVNLQCGVFAIDKWDDRIYVYRHDAPQTFNIPAYYGRGCWIAAYCRIMTGKFVRLYFTMDCTSYPWARQGDTHARPSAGAKLQCVVRLQTAGCCSR